MKQVKIERHIYAPELTQVYVRGVKLPLPLHVRHKITYCRTMADAQRVLRQVFKPARVGRVAVIKKEYPDELYEWLNQSFQGYATYRDALKFAESVKQGAVLEHRPIVSVKTYLIG